MAERVRLTEASPEQLAAAGVSVDFAEDGSLCYIDPAGRIVADPEGTAVVVATEDPPGIDSEGVGDESLASELLGAGTVSVGRTARAFAWAETRDEPSAPAPSAEKSRSGVWSGPSRVLRRRALPVLGSVVALTMAAGTAMAVWPGSAAEHEQAARNALRRVPAPTVQVPTMPVAAVRWADKAQSSLSDVEQQLSELQAAAEAWQSMSPERQRGVVPDEVRELKHKISKLSRKEAALSTDLATIQQCREIIADIAEMERRLVKVTRALNAAPASGSAPAAQRLAEQRKMLLERIAEQRAALQRMEAGMQGSMQRPLPDPPDVSELAAEVTEMTKQPGDPTPEPADKPPVAVREPEDDAEVLAAPEPPDPPEPPAPLERVDAEDAREGLSGAQGGAERSPAVEAAQEAVGAAASGSAVAQAAEPVEDAAEDVVSAEPVGPVVEPVEDAAEDAGSVVESAPAVPDSVAEDVPDINLADTAAALPASGLLDGSESHEDSNEPAESLAESDENSATSVGPGAESNVAANGQESGSGAVTGEDAESNANDNASGSDSAPVETLIEPSVTDGDGVSKLDRVSEELAEAFERVRPDNAEQVEALAESVEVGSAPEDDGLTEEKMDRVRSAFAEAAKEARAELVSDPRFQAAIEELRNRF